MDKEEKNAEMPDIAKATNPHHSHHVPNKDEPDRNRAQKIEVCQITGRIKSACWN